VSLVVKLTRFKQECHQRMPVRTQGTPFHSHASKVERHVRHIGHVSSPTWSRFSKQFRTALPRLQSPRIPIQTTTPNKDFNMFLDVQRIFGCSPQSKGLLSKYPHRVTSKLRVVTGQLVFSKYRALRKRTEVGISWMIVGIVGRLLKKKSMECWTGINLRRCNLTMIRIYP